MGSRPATTDPLLSGSVRSGSRLAERRTAQRLQRSLRTADGRRRARKDPELVRTLRSLRGRVRELKAAPSPVQGSDPFGSTWGSAGTHTMPPMGRSSTAMGFRSSLGNTLDLFEGKMTARVSVGVTKDNLENPINGTDKLCQPWDLRKVGGKDYSKPWICVGPNMEPAHGWSPGRTSGAGVWSQTPEQWARPGPKLILENNPERARQWARLLSVGVAGDD